jgi:hypothetical protein
MDGCMRGGTALRETVETASSSTKWPRPMDMKSICFIVPRHRARDDATWAVALKRSNSHASAGGGTDDMLRQPSAGLGSDDLRLTHADHTPASERGRHDHADRILGAFTVTYVERVRVAGEMFVIVGVPSEPEPYLRYPSPRGRPADIQHVRPGTG